jgi:hypothetical protein
MKIYLAEPTGFIPTRAHSVARIEGVGGGFGVSVGLGPLSADFLVLLVDLVDFLLLIDFLPLVDFLLLSDFLLLVDFLVAFLDSYLFFPAFLFLPLK